MGIDGVDIPINLTEPIVVRAVPYFEKLFNVLQSYPKRYDIMCSNYKRMQRILK